MPLWPLFTLPWIALALFLALRVKLPAELPGAETGEVAEAGEEVETDEGAEPEVEAETGEVGDTVDADRSAGTALDEGGEVTGGSALPLVSIIIPARNEAHNIERVAGSLAASRYPRFEIIVVDDRSEDDTADRARAVANGNAERIGVIEGRELPEGWLGKPWACWQGFERARGDLILFIDADTIHGPELLGRAVRGLLEEEGDALSLVGRQLMETFWERLVQPHVFVAMIFRFPDQSRPLSPSRWRDAIASGQYLLFRRETYEAIGGHEAVKGEVVEDLRLAQMLVKGGWRFRMRRAEDALATRMYRSLGELIEGWSKNVILGGLHTLPPVLRPVMPPTMLVAGFTFWLLPPLALVLAVLSPPTALLWWAGVVTAMSALFWMAVVRRFGAPIGYGLLYPLGAAVGMFIVFKSWIGMRTVRWKGRVYRVGSDGAD